MTTAPVGAALAATSTTIRAPITITANRTRPSITPYPAVVTMVPLMITRPPATLLAPAFPTFPHILRR